MKDTAWSRKRVGWCWTVLLWSPVGFYYASHFAAALVHPGLRPTGFIQYDLPYSMACAREFADNGLHGLLFTLPSTAGVGKPVLLQMHLWFLGQVWRWLPIDPGLLYVLFGLVAGLLAVRSFIRFFDSVVRVSGPERRWGHVLFIWGGGILAVAGELLNLFHGRPLADTWKHLLDLDPAHGWWMMNLGRCLLLPNEAYYHLLYFTAGTAFLERRHVRAVSSLILLAASHPFAGTGALVAYGAWSVPERWIRHERPMPLAVPLTIGGTLLACCAYYFFWLPSRMDPALTAALPSPYIIEARSILPAYSLVLLMALARIRSVDRLKGLLQQPSGRLLAVMVVAHLLLENHELLMMPYQPAHFTRGYSWAALFLIGAPWLFQEAWPWIKQRSLTGAKVLALPVVLLILSDNSAFFALNIKRQLRASPPGFWLTRDQVGVLAFLNTLGSDAPLVVSQDDGLGYMTTVYTPLRAYRSHFFDEADAWSRVKQQAAYFEGRIMDPLLTGPLVVIAMKDSGDASPPGAARLLYQNEGYCVYRTDGAAAR